MVGYYGQQFISIATTGINLGITIRMILGVWPLAYAFFVIRKSRVAIHRGLLSLTGAFLFIAAFPGLNAVSLTTVLLNAQLEQTLQRESMISEEREIIRKPILELDTYNYLKATLNEMNMLGLHRFPIIPDDYEHPEDFEATFGDRERDPVDPENEYLFYRLEFSIIDFTELSYESLTYVPFIDILETSPFTGSLISLSYTSDGENQLHQLTLTRGGISEIVDLYEDVALVLQDRFLTDDYETDDIEELLVQITFDTFSLDFWVMSLRSSKYVDFSSFSMSFYLGLSNING
jgi:hypothetical protein